MVISGLAALAAGRRGRIAGWVACAGVVVGGGLASIPAIRVLAGGQAMEMRWAWNLPGGSFYIAIDALSAFFLLPVFLLPALAAVYGVPYMIPSEGRRAVGAFWFFFNLLVVSMALVVVARNALLFLFAWEVMSLVSFFLVTFDDTKAAVREAGRTYLVATHLGTAFLFAFFAFMGRGAKTLDFDQFHAAGAPPVLFLLALVGFGTKAGLLPLHVWLPEAHPAAPSHVSAVMSGVMIKTGIYGLIRSMILLGPPQAWWGVVLMGVGGVTGVLGIAYALAQGDLKRLLAYSSVENVGIITLALGMGILGAASGAPVVAVLGIAGALFHVVNHALFKGLLFLGAGVVAHATGTLEIDRQGGLLKRLPWTGACFLVGAVAIAGLPPLNGFQGELLIYLGAFSGLPAKSGVLTIASLVGIGGLALIGGLAAACFAKAFGIVFLGEPRSDRAMRAHEAGLAIRVVMAILAGLCIVLGLAGPFLVVILGPVVAAITGMDSGVVNRTTSQTLGTGLAVTGVSLLLGFLFAALWILRGFLLRGREVRHGVTWDCGYIAPAPRMQYTGSSFSAPLVQLFAGFLRTRTTTTPPVGLFPSSAALETRTPDVFREGLYRRLFRWAEFAFARVRWLQHGRLHLYVLYIALTALVLLAWHLGGGQ